MQILYVLLLVSMVNIISVESQSGPDPWHHDINTVPAELKVEANIPPDIRMPIRRKNPSENKLGTGEWFFKRMLAVILKGGQNKINEDGSVDISLQMKYSPQQWNTLQDYIKSDVPLNEDMFRRALGYFETSIYKPTITEQIVMAWSEYVQHYLVEYKTHITWSLTGLSVCLSMVWLWRHMSHKHIIILLFIAFYLFEVFISYKEAEQKEMEMFISALNQCKWYFWTSECEVPRPDPTVFLKHMNPLKIAIRMFTTALAEPFVVIIDMLQTVLHGVTDGLWYPFNKITYAVLIAFTSISLIYFLIMIIFNWLLNIPFQCGFFGFNFKLQERNRTMFSEEVANRTQIQDNSDRISQATLDRILNVCSLALTTNAQNSVTTKLMIKQSSPSIKRSASTGRLPSENVFIESNKNNDIRKRNVNDVVKFKIGSHNGSGDA